MTNLEHLSIRELLDEIRSNIEDLIQGSHIPKGYLATARHYKQSAFSMLNELQKRHEQYWRGKKK